jgi:hypothetical protein
LRKRYTTHIETSSGARFSTHETEEDMRKSLIEYYNEVHAYDGSGTDTLPDCMSLEEVVDEIEEIENLSIEETWLPSEKVWVLVVDDHSTGTSVELFKSPREALNSIAATYDVSLALLDDEEASQLLIDSLDRDHNASWFVLEEKEIPA